MPKRNRPAPVLRAALYIRVSTDEQAMHGYSLEAQKEALMHYARNHSMEIASVYIDEGVTARKSFRVRPQFNRMLQDVQADKLDIILSLSSWTAGSGMSPTITRCKRYWMRTMSIGRRQKNSTTPRPQTGG